MQKLYEGGKPDEAPAQDTEERAVARRQAVDHLQMLLAAGEDQELLLKALWNAIEAFQNCPFHTSKGLVYSYTVKGNEMFVNRKEKSITLASVRLSFQRVRELGGVVTGPKKLGVFGASYLYPVFIRLGLIHTGAADASVRSEKTRNCDPA